MHEKLFKRNCYGCGCFGVAFFEIQNSLQSEAQFLPTWRPKPPRQRSFRSRGPSHIKSCFFFLKDCYSNVCVHHCNWIGQGSVTFGGQHYLFTKLMSHQTRCYWINQGPFDTLLGSVDLHSESFICKVICCLDSHWLVVTTLRSLKLGELQIPRASLTY